MRTTRSRGLGKVVLWSPVIEKKKKVLDDGTEGARPNPELKCEFKEVHRARTLRNRVVGGSEGPVSEVNIRRTRGRKNSVKNEENENVVVEVDDFKLDVGRRNLRKRSRVGELIEVEPPRRSGRNSTKLEEYVAVQEDDYIGRPKKQRKGGMGVSVVESTMRLTRSSSTFLEGENYVFTVGKSDQENNKGGKKQVKGRALRGLDSKSSVPVNEVVAEPVRRLTRSSAPWMENRPSLPVVSKSIKGEPVRRSTRSSSTLLEEGMISLPIVGKLANEGELTRRGRTKKEAKDSVVVAEPIRRFTRSSASLSENGDSSSVLVKSKKEDESIRKDKSGRQIKDRVSEGGVLTPSLSNCLPISEPTKRLTRSSLKLSEETAFMSEEKNKLEKQQHILSAKRDNSTASLLKYESVIKPRRSTHSSLKLSEDEMLSKEAVSIPSRRLTRSSLKTLEDEVSVPLVRKSGGQSGMICKDNSGRQVSHCASKQEDSTTFLQNDEVLNTPTRRSTRSSSKLFEDEVPDNEGVSTPTKRSKRSHSKLLEDEASVKAETLGNDNQGRKGKSGKQTKNYVKKLGDASCPAPDRKAITTPVRRLTRSSSKLLDDGTLLEGISESRSGKKSKNCVSEQGDSIASILCRPAVTESVRGSTHNSLRLKSLEVETSLSVHAKPDDDVEAVQKDKSGEQATPFCESNVVQTQCSPRPASSLLEDDQNVFEMVQSPMNVHLNEVENDTLFLNVHKDLVYEPSGSHIKERQSSSLEMANEGAGAPPSNLVEDGFKIQDYVSARLVRLSNEGSIEFEGNLQSGGDHRGKALAPLEHTTSATKINVEITNIGAIDYVAGMSGLESQSISNTPEPVKELEREATSNSEISFLGNLKEPVLAVEVDVEGEDSLAGYEAMHAPSSQRPCKNPEEPSYDAEAYNEDAIVGGLGGNIATDISGQALSCRSSDEILPISGTEVSPKIDPVKPDSKVLTGGASEDAFKTGISIKTIGPMTSDTEVSPKAFNNINAEDQFVPEPVHNSANEDSNIVGSPFCRKSTGVSPQMFQPTSHSDESRDTDLREPDLKVDGLDMSIAASDSYHFLDGASDTHSKTLDVFMSSGRVAGDLSFMQSIFGNEIEHGNLDPGNMSHNQLLWEKCDAGQKIEAPAGDNDLHLCKTDLEVIKKTWVLSTSSVAGDNTIGNESNDNIAEKNGDGVESSPLREGSVFTLCSGDYLDEHRTQKSPEELGAGIAPDLSHSSAPQLVSQSLFGKEYTDPVPSTDCEEILPETPKVLGSEGSSNPVDIQEFSCYSGKENTRHILDQQGVAFNVTESFDLETMNRRPKPPSEELESLEPPNVVDDNLPETSHTANKLTQIEIERNLDLGEVVAEEMDNRVSSVDEVRMDGDDDTTIDKADSIARDEFGHYVGDGQKQKEDILLQTIQGLCGEHHAAVENSASIPGEERVLAPENFASSGCMDNATYSIERYETQENRSMFIQQSLEMPKFIKDDGLAVLDGNKIGGSVSIQSRFEKMEISPTLTVANEEELIDVNCTELAWTNKSENSGYRETFTAQHSSVPHNNTRSTVESIYTSDEQMANEEFFDWSFDDHVDVGNFCNEVRQVDSQPSSTAQNIDIDLNAGQDKPGSV